MSTIFAAHLQAGNEVRKLLVEEIRKADSAALLQRGWSDYDVESIEGEGALRVARIAGRALSSRTSREAGSVSHSR